MSSTSRIQKFHNSFSFWLNKFQNLFRNSPFSFSFWSFVLLAFEILFLSSQNFTTKCTRYVKSRNDRQKIALIHIFLSSLMHFLSSWITGTKKNKGSSASAIARDDTSKILYNCSLWSLQNCKILHLSSYMFLVKI